MPVYAYKGLNSSGKEQKGLLDAESPKMLRATLKKQGIRIVDFQEETKKEKAKRVQDLAVRPRSTSASTSSASASPSSPW